MRSRRRAQLYLADPRRLLVFLTGLGAAAGCVASLASGDSRAGNDRCGGVAECRALVERAKTELAECSVVCNTERQRLEMARNAFRRELESEYSRNNARERENLERERERESARQASERRRVEELRQERERAERAAEREYELEVLRTKNQLELERRHLEFERAVDYFRQLSPQERQFRLVECHSNQGADCDRLAVQLVQAAPDKPEKHALAARHEMLRAGLSVPAERETREESARPAATRAGASVL